MLARAAGLQPTCVAFHDRRATMARATSKKSKAGGFEAALRKAALRLPGVEEGVACEGTAAESRTFKIGKRAFLFVRPAALMLKVDESAETVRRLANEDSRYRIGAGGWVTVTLGSLPPPLRLIARWMNESYRGMAASKRRK
jgi:hypothetical protein